MLYRLFIVRVMGVGVDDVEVGLLVLVHALVGGDVVVVPILK